MKWEKDKEEEILNLRNYLKNILLLLKILNGLKFFTSFKTTKMDFSFLSLYLYVTVNLKKKKKKSFLGLVNCLKLSIVHRWHYTRSLKWLYYVN